MPRLLEPCYQRKAGGDFGPHRHVWGLVRCWADGNVPPAGTCQLRDSRRDAAPSTGSIVLTGHPGMKQVIDAGIAPKTVALAERVIAHADQFVGFQSDTFCPARQFRRFDKFRVVMGSLRPVSYTHL